MWQPTSVTSSLTAMSFITIADIDLTTKSRFPLPELTGRQHSPSTRLVETRARQHSPCWRVMETGHPSTRAVNLGSGNRA